MKKKKDLGLSRSELMLLTVTEIISELVTAHENKQDVDLNKLKSAVSRKYGLSSQPRLVDIIAAVPANYKKTLLPKLKAKPIRTASGVSNVILFILIIVLIYKSLVHEFSHAMECWNTSITRQLGEIKSRTFRICVAKLKQCTRIQGFFCTFCNHTCSVFYTHHQLQTNFLCYIE